MPAGLVLALYIDYISSDMVESKQQKIETDINTSIEISTKS